MTNSDRKLVKSGALTCTIYMNHPVGNLMGKHFMSEIGFIYRRRKRFTAYPNSPKNTEKNTKIVFPQPVANNLQNIPNRMT